MTGSSQYLSHEAVRINERTYILSTRGDHAVELRLCHPGGENVLFWFPPAEPTGLALDALRHAGFATTNPFARVSENV